MNQKRETYGHRQNDQCWNDVRQLPQYNRRDERTGLKGNQKIESCAGSAGRKPSRDVAWL